MLFLDLNQLLFRQQLKMTSVRYRGMIPDELDFPDDIVDHMWSPGMGKFVVNFVASETHVRRSCEAFLVNIPVSDVHHFPRMAVQHVRYELLAVAGFREC